MKKYFMAGTEDEVQMGDVIEVVITKINEKGHLLHKKMEFKLTPATLPYALDLEDSKGNKVIEEREIEDEKDDNDLLDFEDEELNMMLDHIIDTQEELEKRVENLEDCVKNLIDSLNKPKKENTASKKK